MNTQATSSLPFPSPISIPPGRLSLSEALASATETSDLRLGAGASRQVAGVFAAQFPGQKAVVVADRTTHPLLGETVQRILQAAGLAGPAPFIFSEPGLYAEYRYVSELQQSLSRHEAIPVAVGSGTINDLTKLAAHHLGRPYLCVATAASMDGYTAFGASITFNGAKQTFNCPAPRAVVADTDIIRRAPSEMTASGYADLQAKITAGADWLVADALQVEPIDPRAWAIVQGGLQSALADPTGARAGQPSALSELTEGLMLGGFAMQLSKSSRPASGAEHQFSHLWDMERHVHHGAAPAHGFKVGIATLAITSLYEYLLQQPLDQLDVDACCARWPDQTRLTADIRARFADSEFTETAATETLAKYIPAEELRSQLTQLRATWPVLRERLRAQLVPLQELKRRLAAVGAPFEPEAIGITRARLRATFERAYHIRRRFTVLDLAVRTGQLTPALDALFAPGGPWATP